MIVFEPNFRGSIGYGSDFYAANRGKLGYIDYDDIMAGVDYLIKNKMADENKMVVGGWSYGGYMTDWIIGHTNRFKAAVSVAGMSNTVSHYAQSDINHGVIADWEYIGLPIFDMENYTRSSPLSFFDKAKTPTLIMHGEADTRVSVMQSWEIYRALIDNGIEVEMVLYPGAGHSITAPKQRKNVFERWVDWYRKYLNE
jgi:dipeptidyl aminopeptidase/acylaminoacyl peptidase